MVGEARRPTRPIGAAGGGRGTSKTERERFSAAEAERLASAAEVDRAGRISEAEQHGATEAELVADGLLVSEEPTILAAEADAIAAEFRATAATDAATPITDGENAAAAAGELTAETIEQAYKILGGAIVSQGAAVFIPNWHITRVETDDMSSAIVQALQLWFPDGIIPPKYMAILAVVAVGGRIAMARKDPETGELPPRIAPPPRRAANGAAPPAGVSHINPTH